MNSPVGRTSSLTRSMEDWAARAILTSGDAFEAVRTPTPCLDSEEEDEESRLFEAQARKDLESYGCPPCYPSHFSVPVRDPPEEYRPLIEYWQSTGGRDVPLCAQICDWRKFRAFQLRMRAYYPEERFSIYMDRARERRRRHGLDGDVHLLLDSEQQTQKQNWIEFQGYHCKKHEEFVKEREKFEQMKNDDTQTKAADTDHASFERAKINRLAIAERLRYNEKCRRKHEVLLGWIEQQRLAMNVQPQTPIEEDSHGQNAASEVVRTVSTCQNRSKRPGRRGAGQTLDRARPQRRSAAQRSHPALGTITTRSGRISKPPARFIPG
ncbi:MAG: hypothetical protein Q9163_001587 [Psora crenata]